MWLKQRVMRNQECDASNVLKGHRYFPFLSVNVCTCFCLSIGFCLFVICCFFQKDPMAFSITKKRNNNIFFKCQNDKISFQHWKDTRTHARQITKCTLQSWYQMSLARKQNMPDQSARRRRVVYIASQITTNREFMPYDLSKFLNSTPEMFRNRDYKKSMATRDLRDK